MVKGSYLSNTEKLNHPISRHIIPKKNHKIDKNIFATTDFFPFFSKSLFFFICLFTPFVLILNNNNTSIYRIKVQHYRLCFILNKKSVPQKIISNFWGTLQFF